MRIISWNINGIRATNDASSMKSLLDSLNADVICLQETKVTRNLLADELANVDGYLAFFSFSRKKGGYSGVVTYCKRSCCPASAEEGLSGILTKDDNLFRIGHPVTDIFPIEPMLSLDGEGRALFTEHKVQNDMDVCILNVYCPHSIVENVERYTYKMNFYKLLEARCKSLTKAGKHVIVVGDLNVSHKRIDHCDPDDDFEKSIARLWLNKMLGIIGTDEKNDDDDDDNCIENDLTDVNDSSIFVDVFRVFHPTEKNAFTCWNTKTRARETNYGTRIDYVLANKKLVPYFKDCCIRPDILGSDHCPVQCDINFIVTPSKVIPDLCAIFMPEFSGKQVGITTYFSKKSSDNEDQEEQSSNKDCCQSDSSHLFVSKKRTCNFSQDTVSKSRKISAKKQSKNLFCYFQTNCQSEKSVPEKEEDNVNTKTDSVNSEEMWNSANYISNPELKTKNSVAKESWKNILKGPESLPLCSGHKERSVLRTVKKEGPNLGRQFYCCNRPAGHSSNKDARCGFFQWKQ